MNNSKKIFAGLMALSMMAGLTACGNNDGSSDATSEETTTTTTAKTVAVNTEELKEDEAAALEDTMSQLQDVELENKTIKWLAHYDLNPSSNGASKSIGLEMFEKKYGGEIQYYPTTWENRFNDLSTYVLGGEGIDFFPGDDTANFPKGIVSGMFQPVDDYIDMNSAIWQNTKDAMELLNFGGKHYQFVTGVTAEQLLFITRLLSKQMVSTIHGISMKQANGTGIHSSRCSSTSLTKILTSGALTASGQKRLSSFLQVFLQFSLLTVTSFATSTMQLLKRL